MARFSVANATGIANDANEPIGALWNTGTVPVALAVYHVDVAHLNTSASNVRLFRISTRGTAGGSFTPDLDNHHGRRAGPASGAILDRGNYTAAPTQETPQMLSAQLGAAAGSAHEWWFPEPIMVPPGTGLAIYSTTAYTTAHVRFTWEE